MHTDLIEAANAYIDAHGGGDGIFPTPVPGVGMLRSRHPTAPYRMVYKPALCIILTGAKQVRFGDRVFDYGAMQSLVVNLELPALGRITLASPQRPYLGINIEFDVGHIRSIMAQLARPPEPSADAGPGIFVSDLDLPSADCVLRLIRMLDNPSAVAVLSPAVVNELCFWLLTGPHGGEVCKLALPNSHTQRVADAIHVLRDHFSRALPVEELADAARMSPSSFHHHFKHITSMTPLQYQKQLRLLEARRLMVVEAANVASAAFQVGYESVSQFSREYARMFGMPPKRDVAEQKTG